jgi:Na+-translocating ferredoxin:NAD+ oxidoreductase RnfG subunit
VICRALPLVLLLLAVAPARAEGLYLNDAQLAAQLFPEAAGYAADTVELTDAEAAEMQRTLGFAIETHRYHRLTARDSAGVKGTIFVFDVLGQNSPITFGVGITPAGLIRGVEVVAYREPRGEEIRNPRFLRQLEGKSVKDKLALGVDVDAVTGATISSRSATFAARKALALAAVLAQRAAATAQK